MTEKRFKGSKSTNTDSNCPVCKFNLLEHDALQLIQCAVSELSKNKTKEMFEQQNHILYSNIKSSRKGGPIFE